MLTFLLGLAISVPLSIFANLYTPKVQDALAKRSITRVSKRRKQVVGEYLRTKRYAEDHARFQIVLTHRIIISLGLLASTGMLYSAAGFFALSDNNKARENLSPIAARFTEYAVPPTLLLGTLGLTMINVLLFSSARLISRVLAFEEYAETVRTRLRELGVEPPQTDDETENAADSPTSN